MRLGLMGFMSKRKRIMLVVSYVLAVIGCVCLLLFLASTVFPELRFLKPAQSFLLVAGLMWPPVSITNLRRFRRELCRP